LRRRVEWLFTTFFQLVGRIWAIFVASSWIQN
jgi:hypothetical protein